MAPSQYQNMETLEYSHKKFNCGYSHKKLGMRLMHRNSQEEEMKQQLIQKEDNETNENYNKPTIFRPYALHNKSNKEATQTTNPQLAKEQQTCNTYTPQPQHYMPFYVVQQTVQQSQEEYILKLQRQRAALYMKHVMQFYENGNGWPSVHPNAINNPALFSYHNY